MQNRNNAIANLRDGCPHRLTYVVILRIILLSYYNLGECMDYITELSASEYKEKVHVKGRYAISAY